MNVVMFFYRSQLVLLVPRLFVASVACPSCKQPNDHDLQFCERCGYNHDTIGVWLIVRWILWWLNIGGLCGNPAASLTVKSYFIALKEEQLLARTVPI